MPKFKDDPPSKLHLWRLQSVTKFLRLAAVAAFASLLAACGGGGNQSALPTGVAPSNTMISPQGEVAHIMLTRDLSSLVIGRTAQRHGGGGSTNMTLHGGPVSTAPVVYLVLYGSAWGGSSGGGSGDPDHAAAYLQGFYKAVGGTRWHNTETQYYGANGVHIANTLNFAGTIYDATNPSNSPTQSQLAAEAAKIAVQTGQAGPNVSYVLALPSGVSPSGFKTQYCAWHSSTSSSVGTVSYTNLPYQPDAGSGCGANSVSGVNDGFSIVGGHEQAETETDPQPNTGWLDSSNGEIGDKCAWVNLGFGITGYPTQPLWSNAITGCTQST